MSVRLLTIKLANVRTRISAFIVKIEFDTAEMRRMNPVLHYSQIKTNRLLLSNQCFPVFVGPQDYTQKPWLRLLEKT